MNMETSHKQKFSAYNGFENVFKSDKLCIVNEDGTKIKYIKRFNKNSDSEPLVVSKYTKLNNLIKSIKDCTFYFSSPEKWLDPFEMLFYESKFKIGNENCVIHASCFACNDIENEEGFWNIWSIGEKDPIVRVTYNIQKILKALNEQADNKYVFYLGGMNYTSRENIIQESKKTVSNSYPQIDDCLNLLSFKRNAYKYENELRLFVKSVVRSNYDIKETIIENIDYSQGIIEEITLAPAKPFGNSDPSRDKMSKHQTCHNLPVKEKIKKILNEKEIKCKINQSALYCTDITERTFTI